MLTYTLHHGRPPRPVLRLVPGASGLYRIEWPDISLSDLANLTRCKQAALVGRKVRRWRTRAKKWRTTLEIIEQFFVVSLAH